MRMVTTDEPISVSELGEMATSMFGGLVKAVVDVQRRVMAVHAEMNADQEQELLEAGSRQADLWGINLYPEFYGSDDFIEFDSMINIRPVMGNRSRYVEDDDLRAQIIAIVGVLVAA